MKTINKIFLSIVAAGTIALTSCSDYLDVSGELSDNLTVDKVFENASYTKRWHGNIFNAICEYSENGSSSNSGMKNPWSGIAGEIMQNNGPAKNLLVQGYNPSSAGLHRWATQYQYIRQAMIFIERAKPIGNPNESTSLREEDVRKMKMEAKFLIAYAYFSLFELYGPIPIVTGLADPEDQNIDYARAPLDDVIKHIDDLLVEVIESPDIPNSIWKEGTYNLTEVVRPTKVAAMALRAKLWVYAASPLFNGGFPEALTITNFDGTRLFPDKDPNKWNIAKQRLEEFLTFAEAQGHKLYVKLNSNGSIDADLSVYELYQAYNDEILWATGVNDYSAEHNAEKRSTPRDIYSCYGNIGVSQETVDAFFMNNGLEINDKGSGYREDGFTSIVNPCNTSKRTDTNIFNMYANREARFYAAVTYQGKSWHKQPNNNANYQVGFAWGQPSDGSNDNSPRGGYLLYKLKNRQVLWSNASGDLKSFARPSILLRLADFYLYYAEVLNEIDPSDSRIIEYVDRVRERAGIMGYGELQSEGKKTGIIGDQQKQRKAIYRERRVELMAEGQRWFDMRRWMICDPTEANREMEGDITLFTGMNMRGYADQPIGSSTSYFTRVQIENRTWKKEMYWYPVPQNEISKSRLLVQNPLWSQVLEPPTESE
ncbi:hypothetical protein GGR21_000183 [Dysgonomonas hofstadii]|uniref:RagB/SusD family nutrient uptake outer membrane protein n=1 Tax=Dysgonomonas hofstadii TaxID=637886 RepID=A0A840CJV1_9BACT|nr:RagB/SusD family nutrient uptake outer membrane protein [Dysgonomonas hofstadii]MBB4034298.1 hypothetical protein [Dysgonomonas hofstadii]